MPYAIMRLKKLKGFGAIAASLQHNFRERDTPNADPQQTSLNEHMAQKCAVEAINTIKDRLPTKMRVDAVKCVEYLFTASPEWFKTATASQQTTFFQKSYAWLCQKYGKENVIVATVQRDETTPHMSAFVVPRTEDGRLSAKEFIGNKLKMSRDQTTFAEQVQDLGLSRGIEGSRATHTKIRQYYRRVNESSEKMPSVDVLEPTMMARVNPRQYGNEVAKAAIEQIASHWQTMNAKAREMEVFKKQLEEKERQIQRLVEKKQQLQQSEKEIRQLMNQLIQGLNKEDIAQLYQHSRQLAEERQKEFEITRKPIEKNKGINR